MTSGPVLALGLNEEVSAIGLEDSVPNEAILAKYLPYHFYVFLVAHFSVWGTLAAAEQRQEQDKPWIGISDKLLSMLRGRNCCHRRPV